jgi:hypothetical protein
VSEPIVSSGTTAYLSAGEIQLEAASKGLLLVRITKVNPQREEEELKFTSCARRGE